MPLTPMNTISEYLITVSIHAQEQHAAFSCTINLKPSFDLEV